MNSDNYDNIDDLWETGRLYNDDGTEIDPDKVPIPEKCYSCKSYGKGGKENMLCTLTRADHTDGYDFDCGAYNFIGDKRLITDN